MTAEKLQDAIGLLPSDLLLETDKVRQAPRAKVLPLKRWAALAAVLALVAGTTLVFERNIGMDAMKQESAVAREPAAAAPMAPAPAEDEVAAEEAMPEAPAQDRAASGTVTENGPCSDHSHRFAEPEEDGKSTGAYCGNMEVTVDIAGERHVLSGSDAVKITDILVNLDYDPAQVCRCMTDITVDTETLKGIQLNTAEGFARCEQGQTALTEEQARILQNIIDRLLS